MVRRFPTAYQGSIEKQKRKEIIFLDEFPWLASRKSRFLIGFDYYWNSWASQQNILVIICDSAASWMIKNIINNKGGLHNRVTQTIHLNPFTLKETKEYLVKSSIKMTDYQIVQLYMAMGRIPNYLKEVARDLSAAQNIDQILHNPKSTLFNLGILRWLCLGVNNVLL